MAVALIGACRGSCRFRSGKHRLDRPLHLATGQLKTSYHCHASGAKASRPGLEKAFVSAIRVGDQLVITRLDSLGRSGLHLVTLGAAPWERGVGLRVFDQGIDTTTAEGGAMFGMFSVPVELPGELIVINTRDGRASARGRTGGRRPKLTPD